MKEGMVGLSLRVVQPEEKGHELWPIRLPCFLLRCRDAHKAAALGSGAESGTALTLEA